MKLISLISQICLICLICLIGILAPAAHANSAELTLSPPVVELLISPNKKVTQTFKFSTGETPQTITPEIHLAIPADSSGHMTIDPNPLDLSSIPLLITGTPELGKPITATDLNYTLTLEAATTDVAEDVYFALVFRTSDESEKAGNYLSTQGGISALILSSINPSGVMSINLEVDNFDLQMVRDSWLPLKLNPAIKNLGDSMIRPHGMIEVQNPAGKNIYARAFYPSLILSKSSRDIQVVDNLDNCLENSQSPKSCLPEPIIWTPSWHNIGPHKINLTITTQGGTKITEIERIVWFFPIRIATVVLTISLLILYLFLNRKNT